jgi:acetyl/propionyl-CoA carboxylase alpha subunit
VEYDPILSKLIVHAENRDMAIRRMIRALENYVILGVKTPVPFLIEVLKSPAFQAGDTFTDFIPTHFKDWQPEAVDSDIARIAYIVDDLASNRRTKTPDPSGSGFVSPWTTLGNWRI